MIFSYGCIYACVDIWVHRRTYTHALTRCIFRSKSFVCICIYISACAGKGYTTCMQDESLLGITFQFREIRKGNNNSVAYQLIVNNECYFMVCLREDQNVFHEV